jgi:hypothetical protein
MVAADVGYLAAMVVLQAPDAHLHTVLLEVEDGAPVDQPLAINGLAYVIVLYAANGDTATSTFLARTGSGVVTLSRLCPAGLGARIEDVTLEEVDPETIEPLAGGCSSPLATLSADVGAACP